MLTTVKCIHVNMSEARHFILNLNDYSFRKYEIDIPRDACRLAQHSLVDSSQYASGHRKTSYILQVLPSGWIIEPLTKDRRIYSMVTYIMQVSSKHCILL